MPYGSPMMRAWLLGLVLVAGCARRVDTETHPVPPAAPEPSATPSFDDGEIAHGNAMGSRNSTLVLVWGLWVPTGLTLALAALWTLTHRRRARREADAARAAPLRDGPAVVQGQVETDGGDAITVTVTQRKRVVKGKHGSYTYWDEKRREVAARPFRVRRDEGGVVQVIPSARVLLRDRIEAPEHIDDTTRRRFVRLRAGERVWVSGVLSGARDARSEGAYREAQQAPTMKRGFSRLIVSTEAPGAYYQERAAKHRGWFRGTLITLAVVHGLLLGDVTTQILSGHTVHAWVTRTTTWREWVKPKNSPGRWVRHYSVWARADGDRGEDQFDVSFGFYSCVEQGRCRTIPTQRALLTANLLRDVGRGPTLHNVQAGILSMTGWITLLAYLWTVLNSRPWYAGGKIDEGP